MSKFESAPEVAPSSQPERRWAEAEDLQQVGIDRKEAGTHYDATRASPQSNWRKWIIPLLIASAVAALGVGIGIGYAVHNHDKTASTSGASRLPTKTLTVTSTVTAPPANTAPTLGATSTDVNRGIVGISDYVCNNETTYQSPYNVKFTRMCGIDYPQSDYIYGSLSSKTVSDIFSTIVYNFEDCMDVCAQYNAQIGSVLLANIACGALTYNANITEQLFRGDGDVKNYFLKNARGMGTSYVGSSLNNDSLFASAYLNT